MKFLNTMVRKNNCKCSVLGGGEGKGKRVFSWRRREWRGRKKERLLITEG